jgi:hypothetical protein
VGAGGAAGAPAAGRTPIAVAAAAATAAEPTSQGRMTPFRDSRHPRLGPAGSSVLRSGMGASDRRLHLGWVRHGAPRRPAPVNTRLSHLRLHFGGTSEPRAMATVGRKAAAGLMFVLLGAIGSRGFGLARLAGVAMARTLGIFALPVSLAYRGPLRWRPGKERTDERDRHDGRPTTTGVRELP